MFTTILALLAFSTPAEAHPKHYHSHNVRREHQVFHRRVFVAGHGWVLRSHAKWVPGRYVIIHGKRRWVSGHYVYVAPRRAR